MDRDGGTNRNQNTRHPYRYLFNNSVNTSTYEDQILNELTNLITSRLGSNRNSFFPIRNNVNLTSLINQTLYQKNNYKKVISEKGLAELKIVTFKQKEFDTKECAITQEEFKENEKITQLPCKHIFSTDAIETWLKEESHKCPVCRYELDFKEIKEKKESNNETEVLSDSDEDMPELEEDIPELEEDIPELEEEITENTRQETQQDILNDRRLALRNLNRIISNIQFASRPRDNIYSVDRDLQYALMASLNNENNNENEKIEEDFLMDPDTEFDNAFNEILTDSDEDDGLNSVD